MPSISLSVYTCTISLRNKPTELINLSSVDNGINLREFIFNFINNELSQYSINREIKDTLINEKADLNKDGISGVLRYGEFGFTSDIVNVETNQNSYSRKTVDAELVPYFFNFQLVDTRKKGILIFQRFGNLGIKGSFIDRLNKHFNEKYDSLKLTINHVIPKEMLNEYFNAGELVGISFSQINPPTDIADVYKGNIGSEEIYHYTYSITAKRGGHLGSRILKILKEFLNGENDLGIIEIIPKGYQNSKIKATIKHKGRTRVFDMQNVAGVRSYIDISEEVNIQKNGHPEYDSIKTISDEIINEISSSLFGGNDVK